MRASGNGLWTLLKDGIKLEKYAFKAEGTEISSLYKDTEVSDIW